MKKKDTQKENRPTLDRFERASLLGFRAKRLQAGACPTIDVTGFSPTKKPDYWLAIAEAELNQGKLPNELPRFVAGRAEVWNPNFMRTDPFCGPIC